MAKRTISDFKLIFLFLAAIIAILSSVQCQDGADFSDPAVLQLITQILYSRITNLTTFISGEFYGQSKSCIRDPKSDWDQAFNFSSDLGFLASCIQSTRGDVTRRVCTAAEVKFYFRSFFESGSIGTNYLKPNKNCNLSSWVSGCEPGWACSVSQNQKLDMKNSQDIPVRIHDCQTCCEGFFCPHGITCMIPCPLGSYCPIATLNKTTGECEPYNYQLPLGKLNHTCGGANTWADVSSNSELFCSSGSFCPTTTKKKPCSSGHYCRMGSTAEKPCFKLTSCNPNTANQNMRAYGIMVIASLSTLLLIIYNCSDQLLMNRSRREAKTREAAARSAKEATRARKRWNSAKDAAKKHGIKLQSQISSKVFSKTHATKSEELKILNQSISEPSVEEKKKTDEFIKMVGLCEVDNGSFDGSRMKDADINIRKNLNPPKGKEIVTDSQVFKYAYGQIEKEKALEQANKNLTFSGLISMATNMELRKRPVMELIFKDLTVTLKGKNKKLLRCVTGKIKPGHITAVMGPSGAGKTTFLSILAGKPTGCNRTGEILINGKNESIHSYKKIVGFVPQDDIVHGNLTVEENLWFSAKCRLSMDLALPEKVLIVERVIESLGLDAVRGCVVGTVEKRGISGGQRKRVNVGLEMVMEPSLLFLDEPTSGLDSSSSHLLLRALRHETLEGVNICMVVHQPSYAVYQMFDDLILLAEGGFTVYHGPVNKAQEYFASLGINVPEHVNPPDLFIDVLEGIVKPPLGSGVNYRELPIRWMIRNGYPVPLDMQRSDAHFSLPVMDQNRRGRSSSKIPNGVVTQEQSVVRVLWQDIKFIVELKRDNVRHNFLRFKDSSKRKTPGVIQQYRFFLGRVGKQRLREARMQAVDYLILLLAGACLGSITKVSDQSFGASAYTYTIIAVSLLCKIAALRSFSLDKLQFWRESASGISSLAHFLSKDTIDLFNTVIKPLVYLSMFYFFSNPRSTFAENYVVLLCLVYCVTGIAYALAIFFEPGPAQLWSVLLPVILTLVATQPSDSNRIVRIVAKLCYPKWALQAFVVSNAERYYGVWLITRCGALLKSGYSIHRWGLCIFILIITGFIFRAIAFLGMVTFRRR